MTIKELKKKRTATLRKLAEKQEISNWDKMERPELLVALAGEPEEEEAPKEEAKEGVVLDPVVPEEEEEEELKVTAPGVEEGHVPTGSKAERMREKLAKQPKVRVLIPISSNEKQGSTMSVILNGYRLNIAKGVYVDVPEQVADVIMESQKQTVKALDHPLKIKGDKPELDA